MATHAAIQKLTRSFNIQIDNLCQFLPQDRVADFATTSPANRLMETERAAAGPEMLAYHKKLISLWNAVATEQETLRTDKVALAQLESRQAVLQQDVDRLRMRQEVVARIELLTKMKLYVKYRQSRLASLDAKAEHKSARTRVRRLVAESAAALERPRHKKSYKGAVQRALDERQNVLRRMHDQVDKHKTTTIPRLEAAMDAVNNEISAEHRTEEKRKGSVGELRKKINDAKKKLESGPPDSDFSTHNDQIVRLLCPHHVPSFFLLTNTGREKQGNPGFQSRG